MHDFSLTPGALTSRSSRSYKSDFFLVNFSYTLFGQPCTCNTERASSSVLPTCTYWQTDDGQMTIWHLVYHIPPNFRKILLHFLNSSEFSVEPECYKLLSYQWLLQRVHLADYMFLQMVASRLGVVVPMISNANPTRKVRGLIRSRYRAHSKSAQDIWTNAPSVGGCSLEGHNCVTTTTVESHTLLCCWWTFGLQCAGYVPSLQHKLEGVGPTTYQDGD